MNDEKQEINLDESNGKRLVSEKLDVGYPEYVMPDQVFFPSLLTVTA